MSCCRRRVTRAQKQNSDEHRAVSPGRKTYQLFSLGPQKNVSITRSYAHSFIRYIGIEAYVTMSQGEGGSLFCSIYSYQPLSPPPRSRSPQGNDSWRHTQDRSARHTPKKISNKDKRENWTSVLVKVMFGRQTVRKCGLSRPGGEKLLMFGSFGCFETHELVAFEFCCLLELTYCVLACVRQKLGH